MATENDPVRVRSKSTGHEYTVLRKAVDTEAVEVLRKAATDDLGNWLPAVHNPDVASLKVEPTDTPTQPVSGPSSV